MLKSASTLDDALCLRMVGVSYYCIMLFGDIKFSIIRPPVLHRRKLNSHTHKCSIIPGINIAMFLFSIQKGWTYYYCFWYVMFLSYGDIIITHRYPKPNVHNHSLSEKKTRSKNIIVSWRKWKLKNIFKTFFENNKKSKRNKHQK